MRRLARVGLAGATFLVLVAAPIVANAETHVTESGPSFAVARILPSVTGSPQSARAKVPALSSPGCYSSVPRATKDRPDQVDGRLVHVVYLLPAEATDAHLDTKGILDCSVKAQNEWLQEASGGLRWRLDTFKAKTKDTSGHKKVSEEFVDVTFVRSARPGSALASAFDVEAELRALGLADANKRYLSYVAAESTACGDAVFPFLAPPGAEIDGHYAQVYLLADEACGSMEFGTPGNASLSEAIALQELIHNDGIVSAGSPHGCLLGTPPGMGHVCTGALALTDLDPERVDVMFPYVSVPLSEKVLDIDNDDYFNMLVPGRVDFKNSPYLEAAK